MIKTSLQEGKLKKTCVQTSTSRADASAISRLDDCYYYMFQCKVYIVNNDFLRNNNLYNWKLQ